MIGAGGVSDVRDSARVIQNEGLKEDPSYHLLMHAMAPNVAGVIGSAVAAGIMLSLLSCVLSCYDRLILSGTIPEISYSQGMTKYMYQNGVRIFDYPKFAEPFKETIRANAEQITK